MDDTPSGIPAFYYDGKTSRRHAVTLHIDNNIASVTGDVARESPISQLRVSERGAKSLRRVTFPDDAYLEVQDNSAFNTLLAATGHRDSPVVTWQQSWRATLIACVAIIGLLVIIVLYVLPATSTVLALAVPDEMAKKVGSESLAFLDRRFLSPSTLPMDRQRAIANRFSRLVPAADEPPGFEILFRKSRIGPNAFALPSGQIVLTDELVRLAPDDDAIMGVLVHELGHLHEKHLMRRLLQSTAVAAGAFAIFGDVSAVLANVSTVLLDLKYSRDAEREADDYALSMMKANGIDTASMAAMFERLESMSEGEPPAYLSSHPSSAERIERIRQHH
jgi:predicted Zn-dependent protease